MTRKITPVPIQTVGQHPHNFIARALAGLDDLGLDSALPEVRELVARAERLSSVTVDAQAERERGRRDLLARLALGTVDLTQAARELADVEALSDQAAALPKLAKEAAEVAYRRAWRRIVGYGDALVSEHLAPVVADTVAEAVTLAATVPDHVGDADTAMAYGSDAAAAWARLGALRATWDIAHAVADELRSLGALPCVNVGPYKSRPAYDPVSHRFADPDATVGLPAPGPLFLARAHAAGAAPGIYTADEVTARSAAAVA